MEKIYVVMNNASVDFDEISEIWGAFTTLEEAQKVMREKWEETTVQAFGEDYRNKEDFVVEEDEYALNIYEEYSYSANHNTAQIYTTELK